MARQSTDQLIAQLVREATPVRTVPRLRSALACSALIWMATAAACAMLLGPWPSALAAISHRTEAGLVWLGLALLGGASLLCGFASAVPGRDGALRFGLAGAAVGATGILLAPLVGSFAPASELYRLRPLPWDALCFSLALLSGLPTAVASLQLCRRAAPLRPAASAVALALGSTALGAMLVQALCSEASARHTLASHVLAPALAVPALALILLGGLRRSLRE